MPDDTTNYTEAAARYVASNTRFSALMGPTVGASKLLAEDWVYLFTSKPSAALPTPHHLAFGGLVNEPADVSAWPSRADITAAAEDARRAWEQLTAAYNAFPEGQRKTLTPPAAYHPKAAGAGV